MSITISNITGSAQTGLTSPVYNVVPDIATDNNGVQVAVTSLGGTQVGVTTHTVQSPFTLTYWRTKLVKLLPAIGLNGQYSNVPNNKQAFITRKGVTVSSGQPARVMTIRTEIETPAGAETYDSANVRAALSAHIGGLTQISSGAGDTVISNVL